MNDIRTIVKGIARLKPMPQVLHQIMDLARDSDADTARLAEAVACDPVLTANLLKDANSSYYGRSSRFETVQQAVVFLGTTEVFKLVLVAGCRDTLTTAQDGYDLQAGELWRYSLSSALLAKEVAERCGLAEAQRVFTAALLKDIGKVVLSQYVSEQYQRIRRLVDDGSHSFREAERVVLGIDHAELGAMVALVWQFSPTMVALIRHHHQPFQCFGMEDEAAAVYIGDLLCMMLGAGVGGDGLSYRFQRPVLDRLGLTDSDLQRLLIAFEEQMERLNGLLGVPSKSAAAG